MFNLRSFQLGTRMMSISARYPRHHPKRVLALRLATHCGHAAATREYRAQKRDEIANAELELEQIPDMDKYQWGRGTQMGQLVKRPGNIISSFYKLSSNFNLQFPSCLDRLDRQSLTPLPSPRWR